MQLIFHLGRVIFVAIFLYSGVQRLMDVSGTAAIIASKFSVPTALSDTAHSIETAIGMSTPQLLATLGGALEIAGALLIAFSIGVRAMALLLIALTAINVLYLDDFWNMTGEARANTIVLALQNLSLVGALFVFFALGSSPLAARKRMNGMRESATSI